MDARVHLQHPHVKTGTSFLSTCLNGINALSGIGMLSVPYALSQGGWISLPTLIMIAFMCFYTGLLLKKCMDRTPNAKSYSDICGQAFGRLGRVVITVLMYMELFVVAAEFLILEGDSLDKIFPNANHTLGLGFMSNKRVFIMLTGLVTLPTTWLRNLNLLAYISVSGILASLVLIGNVFWVGAFEGIGFKEKGIMYNWKGIPTTLSMFMFCYGAHPLFPTLYSSMKEKSKFPKVLMVCFAISTVICSYVNCRVPDVWENFEVPSNIKSSLSKC